MTKPADVVAVLRREIDNAGCLGPKASDARAKRLRQVEAAVAELIAANVEYDAADHAARVAARIAPTREWTEAMDRRNAAILRRAAALAACKPATGADA